VRLDQPGFISKNEDIVLRLHGAETDYLRGVVFDSFDGSYWTTSQRRAIGGAALPLPNGERTYVDAAESSRWLFAPRGALLLGDTPWEVDGLGALRSTEPRGSTHWVFAAAEPEALDPPTDDDLQLPARMTAKLRTLALEWTAGAADDHARAEALVRHLKADFVYTLDRPQPPRGTSELFDFLFVHRQGHCEFFASAFVALARAIGIPARLVAGFRVVEHNGFGGYAVVRAKHAHAWAEAFVPRAGGAPGGSHFEVFDATPAGEPALDETRDRTTSAFLDYLKWSAGALYDAAVASPERSIPVLVSIIAVAFLVRAVRNRRRRAAGGGDAVTDVPPAAFVRFEALLAEQGFVREPAETLEALAARLAEADREALARALRRYARARYGPGVASESDLAKALDPVGA
jgi:transglutaminase-like putative cysteine protease